MLTHFKYELSRLLCLFMVSTGGGRKISNTKGPFSTACQQEFCSFINEVRYKVAWMYHFSGFLGQNGEGNIYRGWNPKGVKMLLMYHLSLKFKRLGKWSRLKITRKEMASVFPR